MKVLKSGAFRFPCVQVADTGHNSNCLRSFLLSRCSRETDRTERDCDYTGKCWVLCTHIVCSLKRSVCNLWRFSNQVPFDFLVYKLQTQDTIQIACVAFSCHVVHVPLYTYNHKTMHGSVDYSCCVGQCRICCMKYNKLYHLTQIFALLKK